MKTPLICWILLLLPFSLTAQGKGYKQLVDELRTLDEADAERVMAYVQALKARPSYQKWAEDMSPTTVVWDSVSARFGRVYQGDSVEHVYVVRNTGNAPLKITHVTSPCSCLHVSWTSKYIQQEETGYVVVKLSTDEKVGSQTYSMQVTMNTQPVATSLQWAGEVMLRLGN